MRTPRPTSRGRRAGAGAACVLVVAFGGAAVWGGIDAVGSAFGSSGAILSAAHRVTASSPASSPSSVLSSPPATSTRCVPEPSLDQPTLAAPPTLAAGLQAFLADPRVAPHAVGISVWIDGYGEVLAHDADRTLVPASNQKLFTAMGALAVLGADTRLTTELRMTASGDLVIVPGGDPTITSAGTHSVAALAAQLRARGIGHIPGSVLVDESRHDAARRAPGWQDWQIPAYTGPLSAFMVDDNRWRRDDAFVADPALANAERLRGALLLEGIAVAGGVGHGHADPGSLVVGRLESPPVRELVREMLLRSDNQIADMLLKDIGFVATRRGSLADGAAATRAALSPLCVALDGATDDGSGLSRANGRSAREWRVVLQAARRAPWWPLLHDALPVAGQSGTLAARLRGTPAAGNVRAKTGTIIGGAALSGYGTTAGGRDFVFSVIVNGPGGEQSAGAIDTLVATIAGLSD
jgi:D-alanyl-D-alanine carboxypeptidase/D-alanyl-D-alanine-endopeptidase (penicillin-binding protein 4)